MVPSLCSFHSTQLSLNFLFLLHVFTPYNKEKYNWYILELVWDSLASVLQQLMSGLWGLETGISRCWAPHGYLGTDSPCVKPLALVASQSRSGSGFPGVSVGVAALLSLQYLRCCHPVRDLPGVHSL